MADLILTISIITLREADYAIKRPRLPDYIKQDTIICYLSKLISNIIIPIG